jgi:hypothetical protein
MAVYLEIHARNAATSMLVPNLARYLGGPIRTLTADAGMHGGRWRSTAAEALHPRFEIPAAVRESAACHDDWRIL